MVRIKSVVILLSILSVGILMGLALPLLKDRPILQNPPENNSDKASLSTTEAVAVAIVAEDNEAGDVKPAPEQPLTEAKNDITLQSPAIDLVALQAQIAVEADARRTLEIQLSELQQTIEQLQQQLLKQTLTEQSERRSRNNRQIDQNAFIEAGFSAGDAALLAEQINQRDLDLLYLRDQAQREGWLDSERYEEEVASLRAPADALLDELTPEEYDRYLFAIGRSNRVVVNSVIDNSAAHGVGLQPGDRIISYNGDRIFRPDDLRNATSTVDLTENIAMQIDRNGQIIEYYVPAGPLGIWMDTDSVMPDTRFIQ